MSFTDKFIEFPISLIDIKNKDLGIKAQDILAIIKIDPDEIGFYRTALPDDDEEDRSEKTMIYLKSGENIRVELTVREFEKTINNVIR